MIIKKNKIEEIIKEATNCKMFFDSTIGIEVSKFKALKDFKELGGKMFKDSPGLYYLNIHNNLGYKIISMKKEF